MQDGLCIDRIAITMNCLYFRDDIGQCLRLLAF
jgi:hypothetical protein